jgi:ankyrin repeat protein
MRAAGVGAADVVRFLVKSNADPNEETSDGTTAWSLAWHNRQVWGTSRQEPIPTTRGRRVGV